MLPHLLLFAGTDCSVAVVPCSVSVPGLIARGHGVRQLVWSVGIEVHQHPEHIFGTWHPAAF